MTIQDEVGKIVKMTVARFAQYGYFLSDGDSDILLHENDTELELNVEDEVEVFLYSDSQGRIAATTNIPEIVVGKYGWATVSDTKRGLGVFLDIGISKDILLGEEDLPTKREVWPTIGDRLFMTLRVNKNKRIYAKIATDPIIEERKKNATVDDFNKDIEGHIYRTAKVGSWIYTNEGYKGFIHESQRMEEPRLGEKVVGRVIDVKEDGSINVSLTPRKQEVLGDDAKKIHEYLLSRNGAMPYWDKSMPEDIEERFGLSKGAFKRALGKLMKEGLVYQEKGWTYLKNEQ